MFRSPQSGPERTAHYRDWAVSMPANHVDTPSQSAARAIMGNHFFGLEDVRHHCGSFFGGEGVALLEHVPFSEATLRACRTTHILFPGYPLSITEMYAKCPEIFSPLGNAQFDSFARDERVDLRWYLIRRTYRPATQTFAEQHAQLSCHEEVPLACEMVFMAILSWLARKQRVFRGMRVLCDDLVRGISDPGDCRVFVQEDERKQGISFGRFSHLCNEPVVLAIARKS